MALADIANLLRVLLAGAAAYVGIHHLWLLRWHGEERRVHGWVAGFSGVVAGFCIARWVNLAASTGTDVSASVRAQYSLIMALGPIAIGLITVVCHVPRRRLYAAAVPAGAVVATLPWIGGFMFEQGYVPVVDAFGQHSLTVPPDPLTVMGLMLYMAVFAVFLFRDARGRVDNPTHERVRRTVRIGVIVVTVAVFNDLLLVNGVLLSVRTLEYALASTVIALSWVMARDSADIYRDLESAVVLRTAQLQSSKSELEEALRGVHDLIDGIPDSVLVVSDDRISLVNRAAENYFCLSREQLVGQTAAIIVHPDDSARMAAAWAADGDRVGALELRFLDGNGRELAGEMACLPLTISGENAFVAIVRDVTERNRLQHQLLLADRLASVGTLAAGVAHEINNPLAYVMGNLHALREEMEEICGTVDPDTHAEMTDMIADAEDGADRVRTIVSDMRAFARKDDGTSAAVDVNRVVQLAVNLAANSIRHRAELELDLGQVPTVVGDEGRLAQVVVNLLVNASQAIDDDSAERCIRVATRDLEDGTVAIEVSDSGRGIDPVEAARIFDPFYTTKPIGVGTGLGLSICHGIVTGVGGTIALHPRPGGGTVARVCLRRSGAAVRPRVRCPPSEQDVEVLRILVIDDDAPVGAAFRRLLRRHEVTVVPEAEKGLLACRTGDFDVVVCDLMMPGMSGMELYERVRKQRPGFERRFIFVTGGAFTEQAEAFLEQVENPKLDKPVAAENLRIAVARAASA